MKFRIILGFFIKEIIKKMIKIKVVRVINIKTKGFRLFIEIFKSALKKKVKDMKKNTYVKYLKNLFLEKRALVLSK